MHIKESVLEFSAEEQVFSFSEHFQNDIQIVARIYFATEKFLDFQKDLIQEFLADYLDYLKKEEYDTQEIKAELEIALQNLNTKFKHFADKVHDVDYFPIKGYLQIIVDNTLISTMIGDMNLTIFRDNSVFYSLHNGTNHNGKIDLFSDFVEGDLEMSDEIIYIGTKISDILDDNDLRELENVIAGWEDIVPFLDEILKERIAQEDYTCINHYIVQHAGLQLGQKSFLKKWAPSNKKTFKRKKELMANRYYFTIVVLGVVILFLLYHVLSQVLNKNETDVFITSSGVEVDVTVEDIKKDIYMFQSLDPTSDEKWVKYHEIMQKLDMLESKGRWLEDVAQLRTILQSDYHKGFNIIYINNMTQFDDTAAGIKSQILTFNSMEQERMGSLLALEWGNNLYIGGTQGAMISAINDNMRGTLMEYSSEDFVDGCSKNLLQDGLYCYSENGNIFSVTKGGIEPVSTTDEAGFSSHIAGLKVFGKSNIYVFNPSLRDGALLKRYRNVVGSQAQFQGGSNYKVALDSGENLSGFYSFAIDSTFLAWSDGDLLQFWREEPTSNLLEVRTVPMMGGDQITETYSNNVKILSSMDSKYVYILDRDNQTFTVYESRPLKTNDAFTSEYSLYYLFRYNFDLDNNMVVDAIVPDETGNRPELYLLTNDGVVKVNLYDFIDSVKETATVMDV